MRDFITEIRKIPTSTVLHTFSNISIDMFRKQECQIKVPIAIMRKGCIKRGTVLLMGWDIHSIAYHSVLNGTDYRSSSREPSVAEIINLYRGYDNENSVAGKIGTADVDGIFRILMGMTSEQFMFQHLNLIFEKFNRDYYILLAAEHFEHRSELDVNCIVKEMFGYSADDYIAILMLVFWLCNQNPDPFKAMDNVKLETDSSLLSLQNLERFIQYYSCTYEDLKDTKLGKQLLYSKPFIRTQRDGNYITSNMFLVAFMMGNGLYWLARDYYCKRKSQHFVNTFGLLFEDYIIDLAGRYCEEGECRQLPKGNKKGADFLLDLGDILFLIESKSALLPLSVKQQVPDIDQADRFFTQTIDEAYEQLVSSYEQIKETSTKTIIKVVLLYDDFSNTGIIEKAMTEIFDNDSQCFVMTIRELEVLLYLHKQGSPKVDVICEKIHKQINKTGERRSLGAIFESLDIYDNPHLSGNMDYFQKLLKHLEKQLKQNT